MQIRTQAFPSFGLTAAARQTSAGRINLTPSIKRHALALIGGVGLAAVAAHGASATTIDFSFTTSQGPLGDVLEQDGLRFVNSVHVSDAFINWPGYGATFNADKNNSDPAVNYPLAVTTIAAIDGNPFLFNSIGIANIHNSDAGGSFLFTFTLPSGESETQTVKLAAIQGLQNLTFNKYVASVSFQGLGTLSNGDDVSGQFDNITFGTASVSAVPLPASLPMFGGGLLALAGFGYGLNRRAGVNGGTAKAA